MMSKKPAKQVIQQIKTIAVKDVGGVHFDREEAAALRELAAYCMRGYMGEHAHTVKMILEKVPR
jgi:hypothetical protein